MACKASRTIDFHWIETIKSRNYKVVTGLNETLINLDFMYLSDLHVPVESPFHELYVCFLHVFRNFWLEQWNCTMKTHASNKCFKCGDHRKQLVIQTFTEEICLNSIVVDVCKGNIVWDIENPFMNTIKVESLKVIKLSISEEDVIEAVVWIFDGIIASVIAGSCRDFELFV